MSENLPRVHFCWNCDVMLCWGIALCVDCVRAIIVGLVMSGATALAAWMCR